MNKISVVTVVNHRLSRLAVDFLISLRTLGQFDGPVIIGDYGLKNPTLRKLIQQLEITTTPIKQDDAHVPILRWVDLIKVLDSVQTEFVAIHDVDMWFQRPFEDVFELIPESGVLFGPGKFKRQVFWGPDELKAEFEQKAQAICNKWGGVLNCGFMAAKTGILKAKLNKYREYVEPLDLKVPKSWDQSVWQYIFDPEADTLAGHSFNTIPKDTSLKSIMNKANQPAHVVHLAGRTRALPNARFRDRHSEIFGEFVHEDR